MSIMPAICIRPACRLMAAPPPVQLKCAAPVLQPQRDPAHRATDANAGPFAAGAEADVT